MNAWDSRTLQRKDIYFDSGSDVSQGKTGKVSGDSMLDETLPTWTQTSQGKSEETYVPLCISEGSCEASGVQSQHPTIETESNQMTPQRPFSLEHHN